MPNGVIDRVDRLVDSQMDLKPGLAILAMVIDTLSGRSRLVDFFEDKVLLGVDISPQDLLLLQSRPCS